MPGISTVVIPRFPRRLKFPGEQSFIVGPRKIPDRYSNMVQPLPADYIPPVYGSPAPIVGGIYMPPDKNELNGAPTIHNGDEIKAGLMMGDNPVFPDFTMYECLDLWALIDQYERVMSSPNFNNNAPTFITAYKLAVRQARSVYATKNCKVVKPLPGEGMPVNVLPPGVPVDVPPGEAVLPGTIIPVPTSVATTGVVLPVNTTSTIPSQQNKNISPWLIAGIAGGAIALYYLIAT